MKIPKQFFLLILIAAVASPALAIPDVQTYENLLDAIRAVQHESQKRMEQEKVRVVWETGRLIDAHVLGHKERADYGAKVLERLAGDLGSSRTELSYMLKFFRAYPILPSTEELSWSHYRELLSIEDNEVRRKVAQEAARQNWGEKTLRAEVRRRQAGPGSPEIEKISVSGPGNLQTYTVVKLAEGPYAGEPALDLGFAVKFRSEEIDLNSFRNGEMVQLRKGKFIEAPGGSRTGAYEAYVTGIIDGDTLHAQIDLGFGITIDQKLRLRGLDAPILESAEGREAKEFLEKHLPVNQSASGGRFRVPLHDGTLGAEKPQPLGLGASPLASSPILIQTTGPDKYDRYLVDVWSGGEYLNQKLIDEGLAVKVAE